MKSSSLPAMIALLVITVPRLAGQSLSPSDLRKMPVVAPDARLLYGKDPQQFGELRLPKDSGIHPVAILVHGGCWVDHLPGRDTGEVSFEYIRPFAAALTEAGVASWNLEYRRAGYPGGGWPGSYMDLAEGVDFLSTIAKAKRLDLTRVVVVGHSSGGQLAHWIAGRAKLSPSSSLYISNPLPVKAAVNIDGPPDLVRAGPVERKFCPIPGITDFLGGTPSEQPERYRDGSVMSLLPIGVPQTIVVGGVLQNSYDLVTGFEAAAKAKGDSITLLKLSGGGHFDMLAPGNQYSKPVIAAILELLK